MVEIPIGREAFAEDEVDENTEMWTMLFYRQMKWRMSRRLICWKRNRQHRLFVSGG